MFACTTPERNFATTILRPTVRVPERKALIIPALTPDGRVASLDQVTFGEFGARVAAYARGLAAAGFRPGDRVVLMFPVSVDLYALAIALIHAGMVVVLIDTGMGTRKVLAAIKDSGACAIVSLQALLKHRFWLPPLWGLRKFSIDSSGFCLAPVDRLNCPDGGPVEAAPRAPDDHALITFTSGSTGRPKGADRNHRLLEAQHLALKEEFPEREDEVDMPCFPVVALHNLCCGITTLMPPVNLAAPAGADGRLVAEFARTYGVTRMSGAPAYLHRLVEHLEASGDRLPGIRQMAVGGAPVSVDLCRRVTALFPEADCRVVYGSTEAEPMASVAMSEIVRAEGAGFLVGRPAEAATLALVNLPDPPPTLDEREVEPYRVPQGEPGEIIVSGPHVNAHYVDNPEADRENKLYAPDGKVWHRTGDVGYRDGQGRLWLVGRLKDSIRRADRVVQPLPVEAALDALDGIVRSALVASPELPGGALFLELVPGADEARIQADAVSELARHGLGDVPVRVIPKMPVDRRHNSKIDRPALRQRLGG